jgi:hypothetical protein
VWSFERGGDPDAREDRDKGDYLVWGEIRACNKRREERYGKCRGLVDRSLVAEIAEERVYACCRARWLEDASPD